jgi:hypothetical protein
MISPNLQGLLRQLADLSPPELCEVNAAVRQELEMVRDRAGLDLVASRAYVDRARAKGRPRAHTLSGDYDDSGTGQDFGNGGRWEGHK